MQVTLGGDRLGSGNKNKIALRNYERSTHNLSAKFTSSMQCGVLYPFSVIPAMRGDKFTIDVNADARTIPTKGPLFGSFKMQIDYFQCPFRLYQALLHNNPLALGLKMNQVKLPKIHPVGRTTDLNNNEPLKMNNSSLLKYLGLSGLGSIGTGAVGALKTRDINAIPVLAYYEIFKTYYSNKQETNAYVITGDSTTNEVETESATINGNEITLDDYDSAGIANGTNLIYIAYDDIINEKNVIDNQVLLFTDENKSTNYEITIKNLNIKYQKLFNKKDNFYEIQKLSNNEYDLAFQSDLLKVIVLSLSDIVPYYMGIAKTSIYNDTTSTLIMKPFALANIDDMRLSLLSKHTLGSAFIIGNEDTDDWNTSSGTDQTGLPYSALTNVTTNEGYALNKFPLNGLVVKTYQSDLFNNWVKTEWIDGENGIAAITAINTSNGSFTIDSLNLSEKLYNMLNRVAVSDGSYEGWQDAVYTETPKRHIESPVYLGGASNEIMFEEIVQTSESTESNPLGTLAGKGKLIKRKGGHISVKVDEASFIIGIVSLTPRINYTQGNEWYMTDLDSMDDLHKPALDGIGFQNLIGEQLAWWDTKIDYVNSADVITRHTIGKVPAWINYMTRVDKAYGDFAETNGNGFMILQRAYEDDYNTSTYTHSIKDATTYIDPQKYNYAFAYTGLDAQNFWVQIYEHVEARRLMSAKQIPNI